MKITEEDIRPAKLREQCQKLFAKEAKVVLENVDKFIEVDCPACLSKHRSLYLEKKGYYYYRCSDCSSLYISPRPTPEMLKRYYSENETAVFWQQHYFPKTRQARIKGIYEPRINKIVDLVRAHGIKTDVCVDVGAGSGIFGEELAKKDVFAKVILVEPGPIPAIEHNAVEIINDTIENVELQQKASFITNFELIEHLFSPEEFVRKIYDLLEDGGYFLLSTPNANGFEYLALEGASPNVAGPDHLTLFNTDSIKTMLTRVGFDIVEVCTPGELDCDIVRNKHLEGLINLSHNRFLEHLLIDQPKRYQETFQQYLKENNLSGHMMILACKGKPK